MVRIFLISYYRSRSEASEGYVFTGICLSNSGGGWSEVTHLPSPCSGQKSSTYPPRTGQRSSTSPPDRSEVKHYHLYGQWAGGTHPTGMQSSSYISWSFDQNNRHCVFVFIHEVFFFSGSIASGTVLWFVAFLVFPVKLDSFRQVFFLQILS